VLSLPALRRLRFGANCAGEPFADARHKDAASNAARTALAALSLAGLVRQHARGYDLRSRSLLVATAPLALELIPRDGGAPTEVGLSVEEANTLANAAEAEARSAGFGWVREPVELRPTPKLAHIIRESRRLAGGGLVDDDAEA
jgi:CRISPR-associated protein Csb1